MSLKYFGTDGIRGVINEGINFNIGYKVGKAIALKIIKENRTKKIIIGKDTRDSADFLSYSIAVGLCDYGVDVTMLGIVSTPSVSYLSNKLDIGMAVMVTSSHNSFDTNGIKILSPLGYKLTIEEEHEIEYFMDELAPPTFLKGKINTDLSLINKYTDFLVNTINEDFGDLSIAIDAANGSNYKLALNVFKRLNANIIPINFSNNGLKINVNCGALHPKQLQNEVLLHGCNIGFGYDGDGDRLVVVDSFGNILSGDEILFYLISVLKESNKLNSNKAVGTIITNMGFEKSLNNQGIKLIRTDVGDRNISEQLLKNNYSIGGESSGHVCMHEFNTTCDALFNSLFIVKSLIKNKKSLSDYLVHLKKTDAAIKNVSVTKDFKISFNENATLKTGISSLQETHKNCRIIVRPSGTEDVIRIIVESENLVLANDIVAEIEKLITQQM